MYAQLIEIRLEQALLDALERLVRQELVPALRERSGFCGALGLADRERAEALLVLLWETEEQAAHLLTPATVTEFLVSYSCKVTVWEVDARS